MFIKGIGTYIHGPQRTTFVVGWIRILEGIIMVLSCGCVYPNMEMAYLVWEIKWRYKRT